MNSRLTITLSAAALGATVFASSASAQMRGGGRGPGPGPRAGAPFRPGVGVGFAHGRQRRAFLGSGFLFPYFYPGYDYDYEPFVPQEPPPPPPQEAIAPPAPPPAPAAAEPLVLEYQGDQWVRVASYDQLPAGEQAAPTTGPALARVPRSAMAGRNEAQPPPELPPAVLVFRDGHQEEVERYTIINGVIYTSADYWSTGSWTRKVPIAELNVPATLKQNRERGGKFTLPSGPNEIVIRP